MRWMSLVSSGALFYPSKTSFEGLCWKSGHTKRLAFLFDQSRYRHDLCTLEKNLNTFVGLQFLERDTCLENAHCSLFCPNDGSERTHALVSDSPLIQHIPAIGSAPHCHSTGSGFRCHSFRVSPLALLHLQQLLAPCHNDVITAPAAYHVMVLPASPGDATPA